MIFETDLGHDPDDLFALLWMISKNHPINYILLSPGHQGQIDLAGSIRNIFGLSYKIGITNYSNNEVQGKLQASVINGTYKADGISIDLVKDTKEDVLITGPCLVSHKIETKNILMQGGFLPYSKFMPAKQDILEKFIGVEEIGTFNLNGNSSAIPILVSKNCKWVGKNVCHTIKKSDIPGPFLNKHPAAKMLENLLNKHGNPNKALHDLVAAVLMFNQELGYWYNGHPIRKKYWTTEKGYNKVLADIDREGFWNEVLKPKM